MSTILLTACLLFSSPNLPSEPSVTPDEPVRVLVVTGGHSFEKDFFDLFEGEWLEWSHADTNEKAFAADIRDSFDVLVFYDMSRNLSKEGRRNLTAYVESGKGLVVLHHALADYYNTWPWWGQEVVGGLYIDKESSDPQSSYKHDVEFTVTVESDHPITHGLSSFRIVDETYKNLWISPDVEVLLSTDEETSDGPVAWISPYQKSRVVAIQLGHDNQAYSNPSFKKLIKQAIEWANILAVIKREHEATGRQKHDSRH